MSMEETRSQPREEATSVLGHLHSVESPVLVTGAPGTGKTHLLIDTAVAHLDAGLDPQALLIIGPT
ncbi:MAG: UvrD-helicase domain-containing protein, partial [Glutamicibacter sp.]